ncbi:MAG: bifunctional UDP-N-acetylglucosamine diphosphorylase/glucosamine-1-phosphate N-acetyltransferase GlmU [Acidobacteriota bacterium]
MADRLAAGHRLDALILAAGKGKRMRSERVKLLHVLGGSPVICHVVRAAAALKPHRLAVVVGHQSEELISALSREADGAGKPVFVTQARQLGTAHAVLQAESVLRARPGQGRTDVLILNGDVPLIRPTTLRALLRHHRRRRAAATVLTTEPEDATGYGRVVRDAAGNLTAIIEQRDASRAQLATREVNAGLYCADAALLFDALRETKRNNTQGEYYLPDLFRILLRRKERIEAYRHPDAQEVLGVNDRVELARAGKALYRRRAESLMASGVTIVDPDCTYIDPGVKVGRDTIIHPLVRLEGPTRIGAGCTIGAFSHISDSRLGDRVELLDMCVIRQSRIADDVRIGPFAHLRPGSVLDAEVHVGNFVEIKKARLRRQTKANHLSYLGDAEIGRRCNIGAGTITCNYDGYDKFLTKLGDGVFIGSDTQLVAPVTVKSGAYVGAGSTITKDVPEDALALTRAELRVKKGWARRRRLRAKTASRRTGGARRRAAGKGVKD